jgi:hemin uptake protein HemP
MSETKEQSELPGVAPRPTPPPVDARKLLGDAREILIDLDGVRYRLRITRRNKLILQK